MRVFTITTFVFVGLTTGLACGNGLDINVDFSTYSASSESISSFLDKNDFSISTFRLNSSPLPRTFISDNVDIADGVLKLKVTGGTTDSAEVEMGTSFLYGNVTTRAKVSMVPGTCVGIFTYKDDNHEQDIEILTSYITKGYDENAVVPGIQFTNQASVPGQEATSTAVAFTFDPTADFHDYTIVWTQGTTRYYVDGVLLATFTDDVPEIPSVFILNNWSSGDPYWSAGPPTSDNILEIQSVSGYIYPA